MLGTAEDSLVDWLRAGEALERVLLEVARRGLAGLPLTRVIEVVHLRSRLRSQLRLSMQPHVLLRIGRAPPMPTQRRRRLVDMLVGDGMIGRSARLTGRVSLLSRRLRLRLMESSSSDAFLEADAVSLRGPRLELDELLTQLVDRAQDVLAAQRRLRGLLRANRLIVGDHELSVVLHRVVEAGCELVHAPLGGLSVLSPGGGLEHYVHVGGDDETAAAVEHLPAFQGLVTALIRDRDLIRLRDLPEDPDSTGAFQGLATVRSFLGVPVRVRGEVYGGLYLSGHDDGQVSVEDEELLFALAGTAGVAIANARLFDEAQRRQEWLQASTEITRQLLSNEGEEPLQVIARRLQRIADADAVNVVLPTAGRRAC